MKLSKFFCKPALLVMYSGLLNAMNEHTVNNEMVKTITRQVIAEMKPGVLSYVFDPKILGCGLVVGTYLYGKHLVATNKQLENHKKTIEPKLNDIKESQRKAQTSLLKTTDFHGKSKKALVGLAEVTTEYGRDVQQKQDDYEACMSAMFSKSRNQRDSIKQGIVITRQAFDESLNSNQKETRKVHKDIGDQSKVIDQGLKGVSNSVGVVKQEGQTLSDSISQSKRRLSSIVADESAVIGSLEASTDTLIQVIDSLTPGEEKSKLIQELQAFLSRTEKAKQEVIKQEQIVDKVDQEIRSLSNDYEESVSTFSPYSSLLLSAHKGRK